MLRGQNLAQDLFFLADFFTHLRFIQITPVEREGLTLLTDLTLDTYYLICSFDTQICVTRVLLWMYTRQDVTGFTYYENIMETDLQ